MVNIKKALITTSASFVLALFALSFFGVSSAGAIAVNNFAANPLATPTPMSPDTNTTCKADPDDPNACLKATPVYDWLIFFINLFVVVVITGSVAMIAYAGIEYMTAGGSPEKTKAARDKIRNVVIGLLALVFMSAFLQWLIPGGVFG